MGKVYIAGKINGCIDFEERFKSAERLLNSCGHVCMNPAILPTGFPYEAYMPICIAMIDQCDSIYMLDNWEDSSGAKVELAYAKLMGKTILWE